MTTKSIILVLMVMVMVMMMIMMIMMANFTVRRYMKDILPGKNEVNLQAAVLA